MFNSLSALRWERLRVTLRCARNTFAREHPLAIFEAIFRGAAARQVPPPDEPWFFHPLQPVGDRIRAGRDYSLALIFPVSCRTTVEAFAQRLARYLAHEENNFSLVETASPESRSLAQLEMETAALDESGDEVCLEFITPLAFRPPDPARRWMLSAPALIEGLARRVEHLWQMRLGIAPDAATGLRALPCCWRYVEHRHSSKSSGGIEFVNGCLGPLYLQGEIRAWLPLLRLGQEIHVSGLDGKGQRLAFGSGCYQLQARRPFFSGSLLNPQTWREVISDLAAERPEPDPLLHALDSDDALAALLDQVRKGNWQAEPARGFFIEKKGGESASRANERGEALPTLPRTNEESRLISELSSRDRVMHAVLHRLLAPVLDRLFEISSLGFRPGRSAADARKLVLQHVRAGCAWVVEADIAAFFDSIDWTLLEKALRNALPRADTLACALIQQAVQTPLIVEGRTVRRTRGLIQGSPLSPLLANLFLDAFDEAALASGLRLVRYADDFLVLCRDETEAQQALKTVRTLLEPLRLELKIEKTAITPIAAGFAFLGQTFAPELTEDFLEQTTLRKPVHVLPDYSFLGVEAEALVLRREGALAGRVPLRRTAEVIVYGAHAVSTPLIQRCAEQGVPISFCTAAGHHVATLRPDSQRHFELAGRHWARHGQLEADAVLAQAREVVAAKIGNYAAWVRETPGQANLARELDAIAARLEQTESIESLRGMEGEAARHLFRWVNNRAEAAFRSLRREPRKKADPWNSLLDFAYSRLFTRLNVLLRARGLNPYLGFLHSAEDHFESLVCDLQEPFRARCDRWALRMVNRRQVAAEDFAPHAYGGLRLTSEAVRRLLQVWEGEMDTRWATDAGTFEQLLHAQIEALRDWVLGTPRLRLYRVHGRRPPLPSPPVRSSHELEALVEQAFDDTKKEGNEIQPGERSGEEGES